jgi:hypothetical protein
LDVLLTERVSFVLVGALAAVAQGAPLMTQGVDIVHARTPENLDRLMTALGKLNARYRGRPPESPLPPDGRALATTASRLVRSRLQLLAIDLGGVGDRPIPGPAHLRPTARQAGPEVSVRSSKRSPAELSPRPDSTRRAVQTSVVPFTHRLR